MIDPAAELQEELDVLLDDRPGVGASGCEWDTWRSEVDGTREAIQRVRLEAASSADPQIDAASLSHLTDTYPCRILFL